VAKIEAENVALRHQLNAVLRRAPKVRPTGADRALFVVVYHLFLSIFNAMVIVKPETVIRWHRDGSRAWWRSKSRNRVGGLVSARSCARMDPPNAWGEWSNSRVA